MLSYCFSLNQKRHVSNPVQAMCDPRVASQLFFLTLGVTCTGGGGEGGVKFSLSSTQPSVGMCVSVPSGVKCFMHEQLRLFFPRIPRVKCK